MYGSTEYMSPIDTTPSALSELSLSMALDSGWFTSNKAFVENLEYGKGAKADIQTDACPTDSIPGFCSNYENLGCSPDFKYKTKCYTDSTYSETCYFKFSDVVCTMPEGEYGTSINSAIDNLGDGSRCIDTKVGAAVSTLRCAKAVCTGTTSISFTYAGGKTCTCVTDGAAATYSDGTYSATCPAKISDFCDRMGSGNKCSGDCNGKGLCLGPNGSKTCFCVYGWTGADCNTANPSETDAAIQTLESRDNSSHVSLAIFALVSMVSLLMIFQS